MAIAVSTSIIPTQTQAPLDARTILDKFQHLGDISNPYVGLIFYVTQQDTYYKVTQVEIKKVGLSTAYTIKSCTKMPDNKILQDIQQLKSTDKQLSAELDKKLSQQKAQQVISKQLQSYYTAAQVDAQIKQATEAINSVYIQFV